MKKDKYINRSGFLETDGYKIYWEDWGNPKATPILFFHGGPGGGCGDGDKLFFDPKKHRVIFHDQRGSGKSTPYASTVKNTTQDLISDAEKILDVLGIEKVFVTGGSWGSALSLFYAIAHPERVKKLLIRGVFLARQFEVDFVNDGRLRYFFPEEWERFIALVPIEHQKTGDDIMKYYAEKIRSSDKKEAQKYADEWTLWEVTLCSINYDEKKLEKSIIGDKNNIALAILETHYFLNKCFVPENYILDNIDKIKHIPCMIIQGHFDMCTPPISAYDLAQAYGSKLTLQWANGGHMATDPEVSTHLIKAIKRFFV
jgi:proline iminopeptidase